MLAGKGQQSLDEAQAKETELAATEFGSTLHLLLAWYTIVIAQAELDFWTGPYSRHTLFHHSVEDAPALEDAHGCVASGGVLPISSIRSLRRIFSMLAIGRSG